MFGIGSTELIVILVVALIVLGPKKLPQIARTLGKAMGEFKRMSTDFQRSINTEIEREEHEKRVNEAQKELFGDDDAEKKDAEETAKKEQADKAYASAMSANTPPTDVDAEASAQEDVDEQAMAEMDEEDKKPSKTIEPEVLDAPSKGEQA